MARNYTRYKNKTNTQIDDTQPTFTPTITDGKTLLPYPPKDEPCSTPDHFLLPGWKIVAPFHR